MPICTRKGCGKDYEPSSNSETCYFHDGAPVFHEGLKSWSCCSDTNKPVLDFDEFMKLPGCMQIIGHTNKKQAVKAEEPKVAPATTIEPTKTENQTETYTTAPQALASTPVATAVTSTPQLAPSPVAEEQDDPSVKIEPGTLCRRNGCKTEFVSDEVSRDPAGEGATCVYHPAPPLFREGSKGYLCCKRRVLEFDEFLKITGCKIGRHLFSPPKTDEQTEEVASCRVDHYQTVDQVHVSVFGKQADKERSKIEFSQDQVILDIILPGPKRFRRTLDLFGPIDPDQSTVQFFGTKVELHLKKLDNRSWTVLEKTTQNLGGISLTFGVGGRTGTIGGKDLVLDDNNQRGRN